MTPAAGDYRDATFDVHRSGMLGAADPWPFALVLGTSHLLQTRHIEIGRSDPSNDPLLSSDYPVRCVRQTRSDLNRDQQHAVPVSVDQVTRVYSQAADRHS